MSAYISNPETSSSPRMRGTHQVGHLTMLTRLILTVPGGRIIGNRIEPCSQRTLTRQLKRTNLSPPPRRGFIDQVFRNRIQ